MGNELELSGNLPINVFSGGLRIARESGRHLDRVLDFFVLIFIKEGTLPIQEEQQAFEVKAGQSLILWPGRRHFGTANFSLDLRLYWLHFMLTEPLARSENEQHLSVPQYANVSRPEVLEALFRRLLDDYATGRMLPSYASLLMGLMLHEIADSRPVSRESRTAAAAAGRAQAYIRSHLNTPLTVAQIAEDLNYNPDYLNRVFQQAYHHTLTQEIHRSRIGYARHLLLYSTMNITEVAFASGFTNFSTFNRVFKHYEGISASTFRRLNAQAHVNFD
ncbi:hypothetical protein IAD21_05236 [Abditibacteriota bacterium]|nr:hypothetical protein IAD21_05236 [Abditibacteriota bacterium]